MSETPTRVLIIEDDEAMSVALRDGFSFEGYDVELVTDGAAGLARATGEADGPRPDLLVLDVMLPKVNGLDILRELRRRGDAVPVILLTARGQEIDKVAGLKLGADDYVTKPFGFMELLARVEAVLRRCHDPEPTVAEEDLKTLTLGDITIDFLTHEAARDGEPLELSPRELDLLRFLAARRNEPVSRDALLDHVWGYDYIPQTRTVDVHVAKLRKKIETDPSQPRHLVTVHRCGYKLVG
jgi:DNA-binding response OmpR family regulator